MHQINLSEALFQDAQRRAAEAGFASVDEYVAVILSHELHDETPDLAHFFTPERLAKIDVADGLIDSGKSFASEEAQQELAKRREEWILQNPNSK